MDLEAYISRLVQQWQLVDLQPLSHGLAALYVAAATQQSGRPVVLKIGRDSHAIKRECEALKAYKGNGAVRLLDADDNALLLERIMPGRSLRSYFPDHDDEAIDIAFTVMKKLHAAKDYDASVFPTVSTLLSGLEIETDLIPLDMLTTARSLARRLIDTSEAAVLLHGDLHHENILESIQQGWLAIDPHGVIGEPLYDVGAFIRNPIPQLLEYPNPGVLIAHRIERFSHLLHADKYRLQQWNFVQAVLSACWSVQDKESPELWIRVAKMIEKVFPVL